MAAMTYVAALLVVSSLTELFDTALCVLTSKAEQ
jgi:hypothetical protein